MSLAVQETEDRVPGFVRGVELYRSARLTVNDRRPRQHDGTVDDAANPQGHEIAAP